MTHHHQEKNEEVNFKALYYLVGLLTGLYIGNDIDCGFAYVVGLGITGLLFAALFIQVFVRGREEH